MPKKLKGPQPDIIYTFIFKGAFEYSFKFLKENDAGQYVFENHNTGVITMMAPVRFDFLMRHHLISAVPYERPKLVILDPKCYEKDKEQEKKEDDKYLKESIKKLRHLSHMQKYKVRQLIGRDAAELAKSLETKDLAEDGRDLCLITDLIKGL